LDQYSTDINKIKTIFIKNTMKTLETLFRIGTAGVLYITANTIVKNVARDIIHDFEKYEIERRERRRWLDW
jgi:hypothetical protein